MARAEERRWDTCQIEYRKVRSGGHWLGSSWLRVGADDFQFLADAIGQRGKYVAGESRVFPEVWDGTTDSWSYHPEGEKARAALDALVRRLTEDGWEPLGDRGFFWWRLRFRRRVRDEGDSLSLWERAGVRARVATNYRGGERSVRLLERVRQLRRNETDAEKRLWFLLNSRQLGGAKFRRQHELGPVILDFFCPEQHLVIEVDGSQHLTPEGLARDAGRTRYLERHGLRVLRFTDREVLLETEGVLEAIWGALGQTGPHPRPLPEGEGPLPAPPRKETTI